MFDLAVIGLGPAGLEACEIAIKNGLKVVAFEKNELGGTCLNVGCIPTKAILHSANLYREIKNSQKVGIKVQDVDFDWQAIISRQKDIVSKFIKPLNLNLSKNLTLVKQKAQLKIDENNVSILANNEEYFAKNIIIATGSEPFELPEMKFDNKFILNSDDLFNLEKLPKKAVIIGSGAIGLEWAQILSSFEVEVTLVEKATALAPLFDIEIQKRIERNLKVNKINFLKDDFVVEIKDSQLILNSGKILETDCVLVAVGRRAILPQVLDKNNNEINLEFNNSGFTKYSNLFVVGDSKKGVMLAHSASYDSRTIMNKILFNQEIKQKNIPSVVYVTPEIASVGLREQDIDETYQIKKLLVGSIAKSWCDDKNDGIVKVILKDDKIKGAHIVSKDADSLISIFNILIEKEITVCEIKNMIFPHPSFAEIIQEVLKSE